MFEMCAKKTIFDMIKHDPRYSQNALGQLLAFIMLWCILLVQWRICGADNVPVDIPEILEVPDVNGMHIHGFILVTNLLYHKQYSINQYLDNYVKLE